MKNLDNNNNKLDLKTNDESTEEQICLVKSNYFFLYYFLNNINNKNLQKLLKNWETNSVNFNLLFNFDIKNANLKYLNEIIEYINKMINDDFYNEIFSNISLFNKLKEITNKIECEKELNKFLNNTIEYENNIFISKFYESFYLKYFNSKKINDDLNKFNKNSYLFYLENLKIKFLFFENLFIMENEFNEITKLNNSSKIKININFIESDEKSNLDLIIENILNCLKNLQNEINIKIPIKFNEEEFFYCESLTNYNLSNFLKNFVLNLINLFEEISKFESYFKYFNKELFEKKGKKIYLKNNEKKMSKEEIDKIFESKIIKNEKEKKEEIIKKRERRRERRIYYIEKLEKTIYETKKYNISLLSKENLDIIFHLYNKNKINLNFYDEILEEFGYYLYESFENEEEFNNYIKNFQTLFSDSKFIRFINLNNYLKNLYLNSKFSYFEFDFNFYDKNHMDKFYEYFIYFRNFFNSFCDYYLKQNENIEFTILNYSLVFEKIFDFQFNDKIKLNNLAKDFCIKNILINKTFFHGIFNIISTIEKLIEKDKIKKEIEKDKKIKEENEKKYFNDEDENNC